MKTSFSSEILLRNLVFGVSFLFFSLNNSFTLLTFFLSNILNESDSVPSPAVPSARPNVLFDVLGFKIAPHKLERSSAD